MSDPGTLRFLPWMRRGLARAHSSAAVDGLPTGDAGTIDVGVTVPGATALDDVTVVQTLRLRGPGEVVGISTSEIVRADPPDGTQDFETNYFVTLELATPDLPWMFTPAGAGSDDKLVPWLTLIVVEVRDGISIAEKTGALLPVLTITGPADASTQLPDPTEAWAWTHVQTTADLSSQTLDEAYDAAPEDFISRLVCPRRLQERTAYVAAVIPLFEAGRRAGLGLSVDTTDVSLAWSTATTQIELPVYYSWSFQTGSDGDFEDLVRRLSPAELDAGAKDLDIGEPGLAVLPEQPGTLVSFRGALVSASATIRSWDPTHRAAFWPAMRSLLNDAIVDDGSDPDPYEPLTDDPVVAPPGYGALPADEDSIPLPNHNPKWLAEANLDPVHRAAGGLGAEVVRRNQERLMASAWSQAASLRSINRLLNWTRLAGEVGAAIKTKKIEPMSDADALALAGAAKARLITSAGQSVTGRIDSTSIPRGIGSAAFRRIARPGGTVGRGLGPALPTTQIAAGVINAFTTNLESNLGFASYIRPGAVQIADESIVSGVPGLISSYTPPSSRIVQAVPAIDPVGDTPLAELGATVKAALDPQATLRAKLEARITAPASAWGSATLPAVMQASPEFPEPLYELLRRIDPELLLPGVGEIPDDSVGLVEVNAAFIEAFLLGANHELAREFRWREYPADLSETWLRTFWDAIEEDTADIEAIADWTADELGEHQLTAADGTVVLIIRGQLLRRYPDTVIYASRAKWSADESAREEDLDVDGAPIERRDPLFVGVLDRSTVFMGFALTTAEAKGTTVPADASPGWFLVFEQPPTGPRFGLDVANQADAGTTPSYWKDLSWAHQVNTYEDLASLIHAQAAGRLLGESLNYDEGKFEATWGEQAAAMARITLQRPVRMLVHASAMLP